MQPSRATRWPTPSPEACPPRCARMPAGPKGSASPGRTAPTFGSCSAIRDGIATAGRGTRRATRPAGRSRAMREGIGPEVEVCRASRPKASAAASTASPANVPDGRSGQSGTAARAAVGLADGREPGQTGTDPGRDAEGMDRRGVTPACPSGLSVPRSPLSGGPAVGSGESRPEASGVPCPVSRRYRSRGRTTVPRPVRKGGRRVPEGHRGFLSGGCLAGLDGRFDVTAEA
jgi:hypothetical protein